MPCPSCVCRFSDLEGAYFVQYKPAEFNWPAKEELVITRCAERSGMDGEEPAHFSEILGRRLCTSRALG